MDYRDATSEELGILKDRLKLIIKVNVIIVLLSMIWFISVYFTMRNFGSNLWVLLALLPSIILISGSIFLYFAGSKIRKDYKLKKICILRSILTKLYFDKRKFRERFFIEFENNVFEIDEDSFNKLNGHLNNKFAIHFTENSHLVFRIERIE